MTLAMVRKAVVATIGGVAQVLSTITVPEKYQPYSVIVIAVATILGVYHVPNETNTDNMDQP